MTAKKDTTLLVLREIRDELRTMRGELTGRLDSTNERLDGTNERLGLLELGFLDIAQQQRFVVRYLRAISERDHALAEDVAALRVRVDAIESRLDR